MHLNELKALHVSEVLKQAEELEIEGKKVRILLSKNPVGMNETIRAVADILHKEKS